MRSARNIALLRLINQLDFSKRIRLFDRSEQILRGDDDLRRRLVRKDAPKHLDTFSRRDTAGKLLFVDTLRLSISALSLSRSGAGKHFDRARRIVDALLAETIDNHTFHTVIVEQQDVERDRLVPGAAVLLPDVGVDPAGQWALELKSLVAHRQVVAFIHEKVLRRTGRTIEQRGMQLQMLHVRVKHLRQLERGD